MKVQGMFSVGQVFNADSGATYLTLWDTETGGMLKFGLRGQAKVTEGMSVQADLVLRGVQGAKGYNLQYVSGELKPI